MKLETRVGLFILLAIGIFLYLSINIRAIRLDKDQYYSYKAYFDDTSGLNAKAPIKIAGVEIGWVEEINLLADGKAQLIMRIQKNIKLAKNAYAMIHQDGLIGTKNLEIDPGDPSTGFLLPGGVLSMPGRTPASVGELLDQFRDIATTIQDITASFKSVFASRKGEENMRVALNSIAVASDRIADFSEVLQRTMRNNEDNLNYIVSDLRDSITSFRDAIPSIKGDFHDLAKNLGETSHQAGDAFSNVSDAAIQGRETLREAGEVVEKINNGKGVLGKLINEEETYTDIRKTVKGFRDYVDKSTGLSIGIDMHSETMLRHTNSKGYFDLRLRPNSDYFYQISLVADEKGSLTRDVIYTRREDANGNELKPTQLPIPLEYKVWMAEKIEVTTRRKNDILLGLQFGKRYDRFAFRIGLFEGAFGAACDYYVPLPTDKLHWITTLEAFDFRGQKHLNDSRAHVKWLNKAFFFKNIYTSFGLDDIFSKHSANPFIGGGIRFNDDDLKYFVSAFSGVGTGARTGR